MNAQTDKGNSADSLVVTPLSVLEKLHEKYLEGYDQDGWGFLAFYESQIPYVEPLIEAGEPELYPDHGWVDVYSDNAQDDVVNEVNPVNPLVETCHTHGEYDADLPICPDCKSPLDMERPE